MADTEHPSNHQDPTSELAGNFSETIQALFSAGSTSDTLQRVVDLAVETIDGCDFAGIFVLDGDAVTTPVHTDPVVIEIDALQHRAGEGPCLDAIAEGGAFYADDLAGNLADGSRWPRFGPQATSAGIRSILALSLSANGTLGALNLYAWYPQAFGVIDRAKGLMLASLAGLALSYAATHDAEDRRAANLQAALQSREVIGQAQGILMERERITPAQAFDILRRASQHLNIKLRDVAQALVDTGERPRTGSSTP
ncbi:MAG: GAF and ANTAR domain-containing protein [Acidimicrobiales bacterium]